MRRWRLNYFLLGQSLTSLYLKSLLTRIKHRNFLNIAISFKEDSVSDYFISRYWLSGIMKLIIWEEAQSSSTGCKTFKHCITLLDLLILKCIVCIQTSCIC